MSMSDVTVGIKTFKRDEKISECLDSLDRWNFNEVIVADDSIITDEKKEMYNKFKDKLPLKVLDMDYNVGLSRGRNEILKNTESKYLLIIDDDHVPLTLKSLKKVLEADRDLGGIAGLWYEYGSIQFRGCNLFLENKNLVKDIRGEIKPNVMDEIVYFYFDFIPNVTLFRTECLEEISWDDEYKIGYEHVDFYLNHYLNSDWKFALTPNAVFSHRPKSSEEYKMERTNKEKILHSKKYFLDKWGLKSMIIMQNYYSKNVRLRKKLLETVKKTLPISLASWVQTVENKIKEEVVLYG